MRAALEEGHPGIYRYTPKPELDNVFDKAAAGLTRPMTSLEFYRVTAPVVAALKCGHTALMISQDDERSGRETTLFIPIEARILNNRLYVFRDYSEAGKLAGAEVESINGVGTDKILKTMLVVVHGDGDTPTAGPWRLGHRQNFAVQLHTLMGIESPFHIRYTMGGKRGEVILEGRHIKEIGETAKTRYPQDRGRTRTRHFD